VHFFLLNVCIEFRVSSTFGHSRSVSDKSETMGELSSGGLYYKHVDTLCIYPHAYFYYNKRRIRLVRWDIAPVF
jgi:hypothetical protein